MSTQTKIRLAAAFIAFTATMGLMVQFAVSFQHFDSLGMTLWRLLAYFTILTNLLVAIVFFAIAASGLERYPAYLVGGTTLSIVLVGVIYYALLHGLSELSGGSQVANLLLHLATPLAVPLFWLSMVPKGGLRWRDPIVWAAYPLGYLLYALVRGALTRFYPYPFIDVSQLGWQRTMVNAAVIAAGFMAAGFLLVAIDRRLARG